MRDDLLVLRYHGLSLTHRSRVTLTPQELERQLVALLRRGYVPARFGDAVTTLTEGRRLVVTFDDALRSVSEFGLAVLERLDVPATVFAPTDAVTSGVADWVDMSPTLRALPAAERAVMSWEELGELQGRGWEIGSHSRRHRRLTALDDAALCDELRGSREACESHLGGPCRSVAYPYGAADTRVMAAAADVGFRAGAGLAPRGLHVPLAMRWPRVSIAGTDTRLQVAAKRSETVRRLQTFPIGSRATPGPYNAPDAAELPETAREGEPRQSSATPRVAVIVPCHDDGQLVIEAIESVVEPEPIEIVIVDDASTDENTLRVVAGLRERGFPVITHEHNRGLPAARMTGLARSRAPYVFPLDADDLLVAGSLSVMADLLDARPQVAVCFGDYEEFGTHDGGRRVPSRLDPYRIVFRNDYPVSSLFRRTALLSAGGWRLVGNEVGYEDWHLWMTLAERGEQGVHWGRGAVLRRRLHGQRMLSDATRRHLALYATLRTLHPGLFAGLRATRPGSTLSPAQRRLYPFVFGWRPPLSLWSRVLKLRARVTRRGRASD
jgi:peptidoglycan/xylan/chitin deacetylase (PgdA/CDA1 family)